MKVTQVAICPSEASRRAQRPALTPELLAASGARYSRNNEGLESILAKIDPANLERSVDSIFRMVDYGHQSIADMVPVAMFIDGISIWVAYYLWTLCPTAGGQECSTRYLRLSPEGLMHPDELGIPSDLIPQWRAAMDECFRAYHSVLELWERLSEEHPAVMGIPHSLLADPGEAAKKQVARMRRNYAFDRARYFLPVASATNVMLVMSARGWVNLCQHLLSQPLPEPRCLGERIRQELAIAAPRMLKHAQASEVHTRAQRAEFEKLVRRAARQVEPGAAGVPFLSVLMPPGVSRQELAQDLSCHPNRYAPIGSGLQRVGVRFGWSALGFAEIRDLNRHRSGTKFCPQVPQGFYFAQDQVPAGELFAPRRAALEARAASGRAVCARATQRLGDGDPAYIYWTVLGTEFPFEHVTTADKFIYEAELRTGLGAHFRYARHLRDALALWYAEFPETRHLILEGSAEPE